MKKLQLFSNSLKNTKLLYNGWQSAVLGFVFLFSSCAVSLAPKFDQGIVDNLSASSIEVFQLLSEVSAGTKNTDYDKRDEKYNNIIGKLEALELQIKARPMPKNKIADKVISGVNEKLKVSGVSNFISSQDVAPSATALENIVKNISQMKDTDKLQGITKTEALVFKNNIEIFFDQSLTYERFLNTN